MLLNVIVWMEIQDRRQVESKNSFLITQFDCIIISNNINQLIRGTKKSFKGLIVIFTYRNSRFTVQSNYANI